MIKSKGYAAMKAKGKLVPFEFERRDVGATDVMIEILYCGICHSDIHEVRSEWGNSTFPLVPGHEIVGRVAAVGSSVKRFKKGDIAGVGCMVDSCMECEACKAGDQQFCKRGATYTYDSKDQKTGGTTYGGYSDNIVLNQAFAFKIPANADLAATAPLLCAGITTYSPMNRAKVGPGKKVGVVGLGGLGHMAVKIAHSLGAHVVVFTTSKKKVDDALRLGADEVVLSNESNSMEAYKKTFDFIIDTVSALHDIDTYLSLLNHDGKMVLVGLPEHPYTLKAGSLIFGRNALAGSLIGGIPETEEMLAYCAKHGITSDIELIPIQKVNEAYERAIKGDVKYRFVIDMSSLKK